jgi:hypothetical protein
VSGRGVFDVEDEDENDHNYNGLRMRAQDAQVMNLIHQCYNQLGGGLAWCLDYSFMLALFVFLLGLYWGIQV